MSIDDDPWVEQLIKKENQETPLDFSDPENMEALILRRLAIRFAVDADSIEPLVPMILSQFGYDFIYGRTTKSCWRITDETFLSMVPPDLRKRLQKKIKGQGEDPFHDKKKDRPLS